MAMKDKGKQLADFFKKSTLIDFKKVVERVKYYLDKSIDLELTVREKMLLNTIYWKIYTTLSKDSPGLCEG